LNVLDATALAEFTDSDPVYYVIRAPTRGFFHRTSQKKRFARSSARQNTATRNQLLINPSTNLNTYDLQIEIDDESLQDIKYHQRSARAAIIKKRKVTSASMTKDKKDRKTTGRKKPDKQNDVINVGSYNPAPISVFNFTHSDVVNGLIKYEPTSSEAGNDSNKELEMDSFGFILWAVDAQPVTGVLEIELVPFEYDPPYIPGETEGVYAPKGVRAGDVSPVPSVGSTNTGSEQTTGKVGKVCFPSPLQIFRTSKDTVT